MRSTIRMRGFGLFFLMDIMVLCGVASALAKVTSHIAKLADQILYKFFLLICRQMKKVMEIFRVISIMLVLAMLAPMTVFTANTDSDLYNPDRRIDTLDILLVSHRYMSGSIDDATMWKDKMSIKEVIPLYDFDENILAQGKIMKT